jgi:NDP-sugar pyrophosphorylase family protein
VGPETGGRSVSVHAGISYGEICTCVLDRKNKDKASAAPLSSSRYDHTHQRLTVIGPNCTLFNCDEIINCLLGPNTILKSSSVSNTTVLSSLKRPVSITSGARVSNCIVNAACTLTMGCHADHVFMSECSSLGDFARVSHTIMGPDSSVAGGECHHCLLGPFVGFHHQSLLISAIWPTGRGMSYTLCTTA